MTAEREEQLQSRQKDPPPPSRTVIPDLPPDEEIGPLPPLPSQFQSSDAKEKEKSKAAKPTDKENNKPVVEDQQLPSTNDQVQDIVKSTDAGIRPVTQDPPKL